MSVPKLTYFDIRGRGELARMVMAAANKKIEDERIGFEQWPEYKSKSLYKSLPVLTIDGKQFFQGNAIATYLAREHGLYGETNLDGLMIDQCVHLKEDTLQEEVKFKFAQDDESKAEVAKNLAENIYPRSFGIWEQLLTDNKSGAGFLVGKKLSLGDFAIYEGTQNAYQNDKKVLDKFPMITALRKKIECAKYIDNYLQKRKETPI